MSHPFCLSCGCIKPVLQMDYCPSCIAELVTELATLRPKVATLEAQLTRRDAAFAALVEHVRMEYEMHEGVSPCPPDANCDNSGCPCEHWIARHTQMQSDCREALKLAERVEG